MKLEYSEVIANAGRKRLLLSLPGLPAGYFISLNLPISESGGHVVLANLAVVRASDLPAAMIPEDVRHPLVNSVLCSVPYTGRSWMISEGNWTQRVEDFVKAISVWVQRDLRRPRLGGELLTLLTQVPTHGLRGHSWDVWRCYSEADLNGYRALALYGCAAGAGQQCWLLCEKDGVLHVDYRRDGEPHAAGIVPQTVFEDGAYPAACYSFFAPIANQFWEEAKDLMPARMRAA